MAENYIIAGTDSRGIAQRIEKGATSNALGLVGASPTYIAVATGYAGYATPTDIASISGSATKTVIVTNILMLGNATAATYLPTFFTKRSSANTGGTPTALTAVPHDSMNAAATAVVNTYAAAPTTGTLVGDVHLSASSVSALTNASGVAGLFVGNGRDAVRQVGDLRQPIILRGAAECLSVNLKGVALPSGFVAAFIFEWIEV